MAPLVLALGLWQRPALAVPEDSRGPVALALILGFQGSQLTQPVPLQPADSARFRDPNSEPLQVAPTSNLGLVLAVGLASVVVIAGLVVGLGFAVRRRAQTVAHMVPGSAGGAHSPEEPLHSDNHALNGGQKH